jgi:hypothetical protein
MSIDDDEVKEVKILIDENNEFVLEVIQDELSFTVAAALTSTNRHAFRPSKQWKQSSRDPPFQPFPAQRECSLIIRLHTPPP